MPKPDYKLAPFNRRLVAKLIDTAICLGLLIQGIVISYIVPGGEWWLVISFAIAVMYWFLGDSMNGQSIGKRMQDLKVVDFEHGYSCPMFESVMRNMFFKVKPLLDRASQASDDLADVREAALFGLVVIDLRAPLDDPRTTKTEIKPTAETLPPASNIDLDGIAQFVRRRRKTDEP